jgi:hypothetical protein
MSEYLLPHEFRIQYIANIGPYRLGDKVRKIKGSEWEGKIVGFYSTELTPIGYAVESSSHPGSVQIYPEYALEKVQL